MTASTKDEVSMDYRLLGGTGLKVSCLSFGFWATFGVKEGLETCVKVMRIARKGGINYFDNAETYGKNVGDAETIMGKALKILQKEDSILWRRSEIIISTKIYWGGNGVNENGLSIKHIKEGTKESLKRLQLDYVDILFCHRPDYMTPTLEIVRAMTGEIRNGRALYWGTSEWSAQMITEAYYLAKIHGLIAPAVEQTQYNMLHRERIEKEYRRLYKNPYKLGTTTFSSLKSGVLTGKYNKSIPSDSRLNHSMYKHLSKIFQSEKDTLIPKINKLMEYAKNELNTSITCLAIGWCLKNKNVSTVLLGASKESQIIENLKAIEIAKKLDENNMWEIDLILKNKPKLRRFGR